MPQTKHFKIWNNMPMSHEYLQKEAEQRYEEMKYEDFQADWLNMLEEWQLKQKEHE